MFLVVLTIGNHEAEVATALHSSVGGGRDVTMVLFEVVSWFYRSNEKKSTVMFFFSKKFTLAKNDNAFSLCYSFKLMT